MDININVYELQKRMSDLEKGIKSLSGPADGPPRSPKRSSPRPYPDRSKLT